jgi:membrane-bound ClpP family serine protease
MENNELITMILEELEALEGNKLKTDIGKGGLPVVNQKLKEFKKRNKMAILRIYLLIISFALLLANGLFHFLGSFFLGGIYGLLIGIMLLMIIGIHTSGITKDRQILLLKLLSKLTS